jgi:hypothetical protein
MHLRILSTKLALLLTLCLIALSLPSRAEAAPPTDPDELESAILAGIELRKGGNDDAALDLFLKLDRDNPGSVRLMLQVTAAAQAAGRWLVAYEYLRKAAAFKGDPYYQRNRVAIRSVEEAVGQHVGQFRAVGEPSGAEVRLSGKRIGTLPLAEPVAVELGSYVLEVSKPGYYPLRRDVTFAPGATLNQEVVELRPNAAPSAQLATSAAAEPPASDFSASADRSWWRSHSLTWVLGGVTLAAAATTGGALWVRERSAERWNDDSKCLDTQQAGRTRAEVCGSERSTAKTAGNVALGAGVVTAVFATATLTQLLFSWGAPAHATQARHSPSCSAGLGSFACSGTF